MLKFPIGEVPTRAERYAAQGRLVRIFHPDRAALHPGIAALLRYQRPAVLGQLFGRQQPIADPPYGK